MKLALVGAGGIGNEWAKALKGERVPIRFVVDTDLAKAGALARDLSCEYGNLDQALSAGINAAIVAVPHVHLAPISFKLLSLGIHVLCEKPGGISSHEVKANDDVAIKKGSTYVVGFNHRYHPAYMEAKRRFDAGEIGKIQFIRARYGFGGRPGYEKEWRFDRKISGGGELLDQGVHMIDMARWFMGDFTDVQGFAENFFWGGDVEDNGFALLRTAEKKVAQIHVSWTNWEWVHSFEIFGSDGYLLIDGLDQRYRGPERLTIGLADPRAGSFPKEEQIVYAEERKEHSFRREFEAFQNAVEGDIKHVPTARDACAALEIVEKIYHG